MSVIADLDDHVFEWTNSSADDVYISGSWDNWQTFHKLPNGLGRAPMALQPGVTYLYKFIVNGEWHIDRSAPSVTHEYTNNVITLPDRNYMKDAAKYRYVDEPKQKKRRLVTRQAVSRIRRVFHIKKEKQLQTADLFPNGDKCLTCLLNYPSHRVYKSPCDHIMCLDCLEQYTLRQCETLSLPLTCPNPDCMEVLDIRPLKELAAPIRRLYHYRLGYLQQKDDLHVCMNESCKVTYVCKSVDNFTKCPVCDTVICDRCNGLHDKSRACEVYFDELFSAYTNTLASYGHCECGRHITRWTGCNLVLCICGRELTL